MDLLTGQTPFGVAGEDTGYLFNPDLIGSREAIGFGNAAFRVEIIDRDLANGIIKANHYSKRVYSVARPCTWACS